VPRVCPRSFAQVIKAAEPAFAAAIGFAFYGSRVRHTPLAHTTRATLRQQAHAASLHATPDDARRGGRVLWRAGHFWIQLVLSNVAHRVLPRPTAHRVRAQSLSPDTPRQVSSAKLMMLVPVIGGIVLASVSELDFTWACLAAAGGANVAAAFRGQENKKAMAGDMKEALGGGANAYAIGTLWSTLLLLPTIFISGEYQKVCARPGPARSLPSCGLWHAALTNSTTLLTPAPRRR
jgi:hypothetical protein